MNYRNIFLNVVILFLLTGQNGFADFDHGKAELSLSINNEIYPYREFATYVLPSEHLGLCINADNTDEYRIIADRGKLT